MLFVDFDGVLHPTDAYGDAPVTLPIADMIPTHDLFRWTGHLARLLADDPDVAVVVHSSWRHMYGDADLIEFLGPLGRRYAGAAARGARHEGIDIWISDHQPVSWLILDDDHAAFPEADLRLVVCPPHQGVTAPAVVDAIRTWLAADPDIGRDLTDEVDRLLADPALGPAIARELTALQAADGQAPGD